MFIDHFLRYEANPEIKMMVLLGEVIPHLCIFIAVNAKGLIMDESRFFYNKPFDWRISVVVISFDFRAGGRGSIPSQCSDYAFTRVNSGHIRGIGYHHSDTRVGRDMSGTVVW